MKRHLCIVLALALALAALMAAGLGEQGDFSAFCGEYEFTSGAGAWSTTVLIRPDGSFSGRFSDWDGHAEYNGALVPGGQLMYCDFYGQLASPTWVSAGACTTSVTRLTLKDPDVGRTYIEDDMLYVVSDPYGLNAGAQLTFYRAGTPIAGLSEEFLSWMNALRWGDPEDPTRLPTAAFCNHGEDYGFELARSYAEAEADYPREAQPESGFFFFTPAPAETTAPVLTFPAAPVKEGIAFPIPGVVVNCNEWVSLRARPDGDSERLAKVPKGATVMLQSNVPYRGGDHYYVDAVYDGRRGYICVEYLDAILPEALRSQTNYLQGMAGTVRAVNPGNELVMRTGPGTCYPVFALLWGGEVLGYKNEARQTSGGTCWYRCSYYGEDCWISATYTVLTLNNGRTYTGSRGIF